MSKTLVFGHKKPDTDAIGAAIAFAAFQNARGKDYEAVALGELGDETLFALNTFNVDAPRIIQTAKDETDQVALVDHNEFQQSVDDIEELEIVSVVDHHRIDNFKTPQPLFYRAEPVGCTSTIIAKMFKEKDLDIPKEIAGIMLSAIVSDTLLFKSPTSTPEDEDIARKLAEIAGVDVDKYGLEMLKAGTNVKDMSAEEILEGDAKSFNIKDNNIRIGQINVVDIDDVLARKEELVAGMQRLSADNAYNLYFLVITNILTSDSVGIVLGEKSDIVNEAFETDLVDSIIELPDVVSRKKQVVPQLTEVLENM